MNDQGNTRFVHRDFSVKDFLFCRKPGGNVDLDPCGIYYDNNNDNNNNKSLIPGAQARSELPWAVENNHKVRERICFDIIVYGAHSQRNAVGGFKGFSLAVCVRIISHCSGSGTVRFVVPFVRYTYNR